MIPACLHPYLCFSEPRQTSGHSLPKAWQILPCLCPEGPRNDTRDDHIRGPLSVTTESRHRAKEGAHFRKRKTSLVQTLPPGSKPSDEKSKGSARAFVSTAVSAGVDLGPAASS